MAEYMITLSSIRSAGPCRHGWHQLLTSLGYANSQFDHSRLVSIGDVAQSNGAQDALWCARCLPVSARRDLVRAIMPSARRAEMLSKDSRVRECNDAIQRWLDGCDAVDLKAAEEAARAAELAEEAAAAELAEEAAAAELAEEAAAAEEAARAAVWVAWAARAAQPWEAQAWAAQAATEAAARAARAARAEDIERTKQVADIIDVFPLKELAE